MIGLKNSKKKGKTMVCPILFNVPRQVTLRGNVGTLDATRVVQQFKFGPRGGRVLYREGQDWSKKISKR